MSARNNCDDAGDFYVLDLAGHVPTLVEALIQNHP